MHWENSVPMIYESALDTLRESVKFVERDKTLFARQELDRAIDAHFSGAPEEKVVEEMRRIVAPFIVILLEHRQEVERDRYDWLAREGLEEEGFDDFDEPEMTFDEDEEDPDLPVDIPI